MSIRTRPPGAPLVFSISQFTTARQSFEEDLDLYRRLGITYIELVEAKLSMEEAVARSQLQRLKDEGFRVSSVVPRYHALFPDTLNPTAGGPAKRMELYRASVDLVGEFFPGEDVPLVTIGGRAPGLNYREAYEVALAMYPQLADYAAARGVRVMFEPLSPVMMNTDTFICTLDRGMQLVEAVDRENFGFALDVWHIWDEPDLPRRIEGLGDRLFGVHHSDWPAAEPRGFADRLVPGDGVIELSAIMGAIERAGYRGPQVLEIFSSEEFPDSLWTQDPALVIERSRSALEAAWETRV